jgi:hypothetical protein
MASGALTFAVKELATSRGVAGYDRFCSRPVPRFQHCGKSLEFVIRQVKRRHSRGWGTLADEAAQLLHGAAAHSAVSHEAGTAVRALRVRSMAAGASLSK